MYKLLSTSKLALGAGAWIVFSVAGCPPPEGSGKPTPGNSPTAAITTLEPRSNSAVSGTATFEEVEGKVKVIVEVSGAAPGQHGLHIHEKGDCSDPAAKSAGDHFNPHKSEHGSPDRPARHAGDFGNITVGEDGKGRLELLTDQITVGSGEGAVVGRALVLHEKIDDLTTQPSGNSGARIGCGVITAKK